MTTTRRRTRADLPAVPVIKNSAGQPVTLDDRETHHANFLQRQLEDRFGNSIGADVNLTVLTTIVKRVSEMKFFKIPFADYVPVRVGEGAWSTFLTTFRSFSLGDDFETGVLNTGGNGGRMATADAAVDAVNVKVNNWAKQINWSIMDLAYAMKSGNWDLIESKEKARKQNWDIGLQKIAFLGTKDGTQKGLLNLTGVTVDTTTITKPISAMTPAELAVFCQIVVEKYRDNAARTCYPTQIVVPESDFNGMATQSSPTFPIKSIKQVLEETFQTICQNPNFKIRPSAYGDGKYSGLGVQKYVLNNSEEESIRMDIPVDYTNTLANSIDGFGFQNVGYGQFTGVAAYRPLELMYFQF